MIGRAIVLAGGLAGAGTLSQFPEFSQQYLQRLAGQVDTLDRIEADFDRSAAKSGLSRDAALEALGTTGFSGQHARDLRATFARAEGLRNALAMLRLAGPYERLMMPHRLADPVLVQATWADFAPALPLTTEGAVCAGIGFGLGWGVLTALLALLSAPFRRRAA